MFRKLYSCPIKRNASYCYKLDAKGTHNERLSLIYLPVSTIYEKSLLIYVFHIPRLQTVFLFHVDVNIDSTLEWRETRSQRFVIWSQRTARNLIINSALPLSRADGNSARNCYEAALLWNRVSAIFGMEYGGELHVPTRRSRCSTLGSHKTVANWRCVICPLVSLATGESVASRRIGRSGRRTVA